MKEEKGVEFPYLDLDKGHARESLKNLIEGAEHTAFSGGGEPLLNIEAIEGAISTNPEKKYMITTGLGMSLEKIEEYFSRINDICVRDDSRCVIRISVDSFHKNLEFTDDLKTVLGWFIDKRWERVRTCFLRGTVAEGKISLKNFKKIL